MNILKSNQVEADPINKTWLSELVARSVKPYVGIEEDSANVPSMQMPLRVDEDLIMWQDKNGTFVFMVKIVDDYLAKLTAGQIKGKDDEQFVEEDEDLLVASPTAYSDSFEEEFAAAIIRAIAAWF